MSGGTSKNVPQSPAGSIASMDEFLDRWHIDEEDFKVTDHILGEGSFGSVRVAQWNGTECAIKCLSVDHFSVEDEEDFKKEIKTMQELHHPNIVQFLGYSTSHSLGGLVILMEYLRQGSVEDYVLEHHVSTRTCVRWAKQMAQALAYLHNRKPNFLIHRDLKPANFLLTPSLQCKLGDFGVSRLFSALPSSNQDQGTKSQIPLGMDSPRQSTRKSIVRFAAVTEPETKMDGSYSTFNGGLEQTSNVGTARYMAPEVYGFLDDSSKPAMKPKSDVEGTKHARYGTSADIFSVGMLYYFIFERRPPKVPGGNNPDGHFSSLAEGNRPVYDRTKAKYRHIIDLCLQQNPSLRPTAKELTVLFTAPLPKPGCDLFGLCRAPLTKDETSAAEEAEATMQKIHDRIAAKTKIRVKSEEGNAADEMNRSGGSWSSSNNGSPGTTVHEL
mmetsp:Transcript_48122/g.109332  ORF Transcript_48122/g.109332 Transcript_48122/m.109332 type:complete len:441 (+) Transcript_48122:222-1544(+)|eukprot:CAMPEP_0172589614 /NCGR_PEP_ID=MMETSP1068-20121228/8271_1 /TAXON_ID=35684 /ORGANISM="Pseudopedinella elastica, Strain CCMP716" /LENGTH=440 /DNA_ID=CAMNT_0013385239 /DNA_START=184 /DNA_END=1506 /DNA_ORIENTATION=+